MLRVPMHVLVVEDDEAQRNGLVDRITAAGHTVEAMAAAFGLSNRVAGRTQGPRVDAVVLDVVLPGLSGAAALELLARDPVAKNIPVILYSVMDRTALNTLASVHPRCQAIQKDGRSRELMVALAALGGGRGATPPVG